MSTPAAAAPITAASPPSSSPDASSSSSSDPPAPSGYYRIIDDRGLTLTFPSSVARADADRVAGILSQYTLQVLSYGRAWDVCLRSLLITRESMLALIASIDLWIAKNDMVNASRALLAAKEVFLLQEAALTEREKLYLKGYAFMLDNQLRASLSCFSKVLDLAPSDLFAVKKCQLLAFVLGGKSDMLAAVDRASVRAAGDSLPFFHAMRAFALEENARFAEAEFAVEKGLGLNAKDPWAVHVQAHLHYARATLEEGVEWMESRRGVWDECMSFLYAHSWFHVALLRLDLDQYAETLHILDTHIWPFHAPALPGCASTLPLVRSDTSPNDVAKTSFGVPLGPLSFPRHDRLYVEDQNGALNLLWRLEMRWAGVGGVKDRAVEAEKLARKGEVSPASGQCTADAGHPAEKKQRVSVDGGASSAAASVSASSTASSSPASFPLHLPCLTSRWRSVVSCLTLPPTQPLSLFGLLQLYALCRVGRVPEAAQVRDLMRAEVEAIVDPQRKEALQAILLPSAAAIVAYHSSLSQSEGAEKAFQLLHELLARSPPPRDTHARVHNGVRDSSGAGTGTAEEPTGVAPSAAGTMSAASAPELKPSASATGIAPSTSAATEDKVSDSSRFTAFPPAAGSPVDLSFLGGAVCHPAHAGRLGCLAASGEQLEVLVEFYMELAAACGRMRELRQAVKDKRVARHRVQWYHRAHKVTEEAEAGQAAHAQSSQDPKSDAIATATHA